MKDRVLSTEYPTSTLGLQEDHSCVAKRLQDQDWRKLWLGLEAVNSQNHKVQKRMAKALFKAV